jgi:hypothetical protein
MARNRKCRTDDCSVWRIVSTSCGPKGVCPPAPRLGVEGFVVHGDLAHLGPGDFVVAVVVSRSFKAVAAPASTQSRHAVSLAMERFVCRAIRSSCSPRTVARRSRFCTERKSPSDHFPSTPEGAPTPIWGALGRRSGRALHHSSCVTLRLGFNLPQPGVSIIPLRTPIPTTRRSRCRAE